MGIKVWAIVEKNTNQPLVLDVLDGPDEHYGFEFALTTVLDGTWGNFAVFATYEAALDVYNSADIFFNNEEEDFGIKEFTLNLVG